MNIKPRNFVPENVKNLDFVKVNCISIYIVKEKKVQKTSILGANSITSIKCTDK